MMLDAYRPMQLMMSLWPTAEFELPTEDIASFGRRMCEQFPVFSSVQALQVVGGEAPPDLPRLALLSEPRRWILELAPARVNLRRMADGEASLAALAEEARTLLASLHSWLAEQANLRVWRVGLVVDFFCHTRSSASEKIAHYFLQPRALQGAMPNEAHVALHNRLVIGEDLMVNRWIKVQPMRAVGPPRVDFAVQAQVDLNTMAEDTRVKTGRELVAFLDAAAQHVENDVPLLADPDFLA
jgi:hypothetical protein